MFHSPWVGGYLGDVLVWITGVQETRNTCRASTYLMTDNLPLDKARHETKPILAKWKKVLSPMV
jgi:hypothetical protein